MGPTLKLQGELVRDWAEQARCLVTNDVVPRGLVVDLTEVSDIDCLGERLLQCLANFGAHFEADNAYVESVCERLHLLTVDRRAPRHKRRHVRTEEKSSIAYSHAEVSQVRIEEKE